MVKRGFFAELNYQAQQAEKRRRQQEAAGARARLAAQRELERARKAAERARVAKQKATEAERKVAEKEGARLYAESRLAEVATLNMDLVNELNEIDSLLASTLLVDDFVDLASLEITKVDHPPFDPGPLARQTPQVPELVLPPQPQYVEPPKLGALSAAFGGKKRHALAVARARTDYEAALTAWKGQAAAHQTTHAAAVEQRNQAERARLAKFTETKDAYAADCAEREAEAQRHNQELAKLINDLAFDLEPAIQTYVGIVLSNSVYPDGFPIEHDHTFSLDTRELALSVTIPEPSTIPSVKEYRYVKAKDEITSTSLPVKVQKDRYASAVWQVAVRTLHEVFEADRVGKIRSIALTVVVDRIAPATGLPEAVPLVQVAADRETFNAFDLANVVPAETLAHMGAAMSKSPFDLTPPDTGRGVRSRGRS